MTNTATVGTLPAGSRGFDCNVPLTAETARTMRAKGAKFAMRYVRRAASSLHDLSTGEVLTILKAGLAIGAVQHVAPEGWNPRATARQANMIFGSGAAYGAIAAAEAKAIGLPRGVTLWCDLEGVAIETSPANVIAFCNNWQKAVTDVGFEAGLYVGWHAILNAHDLYYRLRFKRYWSAYNANADQIPAVRGVQMKQLPYPPKALRANVPFEYDEDVITPDHMGDSPTFLIPARQ
jgi:hypothetical protein